MKRTIISFLFLLACGMAHSWVLAKEPEESYDADSIHTILDKLPYFTLFKDNYLIGGILIGNKPAARNSDVKFQLSITQRLAKSKLPLDTYLFLQYTQKVFWNIFQESLPVHNLSFNPGTGSGHLIVYKNKYIGKGYLMVEHESSGKDSIFSQSWNKITLAAAVLLNRNREVQFKDWIPIVDGEENKDILRYNGISQVAANYRTDNRRFNCGVILAKRKVWSSFSARIELSYKLNNNESQYFFLQYYSGYGESLSERNQYKSMLRTGFVTKPQDLSVY